MRRRYIVILELLLLAGLCVWVVLSVVERTPKAHLNAVEFKVQLRGKQDRAYLVHDGKGGYHYLASDASGALEVMSPLQFSKRLYEDQITRSWPERLLNVSSPIGFIWVSVGLLGQVLFTGRMIVQWAVSEKHGQSVVPPAFWWMSLTGATMLLIYFGWRKDPIGLLGQAFGWFVYVRNLYLIYRGVPERHAPAAAVSDAPRE